MRLKEAVRLRILELCSEQDMTLSSLCSRCGITPSTMHNIVSGRNHSTTISTIQKVCDGLEMELPSFFDSDLFRIIEQEIY